MADGKISVASALKQDDIISCLESLAEGDFTYKFLKKDGIKLYFEVTGEPELAALNAKEKIKNTDWGRILYYKVQKEQF